MFVSIYIYRQTHTHTSSFGEGSPTAFAMNFDVVNKTLIFFFSPSTFVGVFFLTTWGSTHVLFCLLLISDQIEKIKKTGNCFCCC